MARDNRKTTTTERRHYKPQHEILGTHPEPLEAKFRYRMIADAIAHSYRVFPLFLLAKERCHPLREIDSGRIARILMKREGIQLPIKIRLVRYTINKTQDWNRELWELYGYTIHPLSRLEMEELDRLEMEEDD